ncbi:MAG: TetR/AcrR family transcriptional regulator [Gammaproteobacteria bacterium]|nr:TetR/AcrR family transcriptional regulator [Gammaproteobacteria bacterium]
MATKGESTKDKILEIAQSIMLQKGFSGTSIDEIIAASDITKGGFFYHFDSKNDLAKHLMLKYQHDDDIFFQGLFNRADELSEDPLQQMLIFLKLLAEAMANLPDVHPGCLIATFTSANQQLNEEVKKLTADCTLDWRQLFSKRLQAASEKTPLKIEKPVPELADMLSSVIEGGIILSRTLNDQQILPQQILQYRDYLRLLYGVD